MCAEYLYWWGHYNVGTYAELFTPHLNAMTLNVWDANYGNVDGSY